MPEAPDHREDEDCPSAEVCGYGCDQHPKPQGRDAVPCSCGSRDAYSLTPGEWIDHQPDACRIMRAGEPS